MLSFILFLGVGCPSAPVWGTQEACLQAMTSAGAEMCDSGICQAETAEPVDAFFGATCDSVTNTMCDPNGPTFTFRIADADVFTDYETYYLLVEFVHRTGFSGAECSSQTAETSFNYSTIIEVFGPTIIRQTTVIFDDPDDPNWPTVDEVVDLQFEAGVHTLALAHDFSNLNSRGASRRWQIISPAIGDMDGNGIVGVGDIGLFVQAILSGDYSAAADANCDGAITVSDIGGFVEVVVSS